jgi:hypothetical protein
MDDPHLAYTKDMAVKNLIALEDHFKAYPCPVCINKHLLSLEEYCEEGIPMSDEYAPMFRKAEGWARAMRFAKTWNEDDAIKQARALREQLQGIKHDAFHLEPHCHGPQCVPELHQHA